MSRGVGASFQIDLLQLVFFFPFTGHSTISQLSLLYWHLFVEGKKPAKMILCHYWSNIYTTLSKLHLAAKTFRRLSTPHGAAGGLASIKHAIARTAGQDGGKRLLVLIVFSLQIFCNRPAFPQEWRDNVPISTGRQTVKKMKMHSGFTPTHVELRSKAFTQGKETF